MGIMWGSCGDHVGIMVRSWHVATVSAQRAGSLTFRHSAQNRVLAEKVFCAQSAIVAKRRECSRNVTFCCKKLSQMCGILDFAPKRDSVQK